MGKVTQDDEARRKVKRLTAVIPGYVSLVDLGANRGGEKFYFSLKGHGAEDVPPARVCACGEVLLAKGVDDPDACPACGGALTVITKAVPAADATDEDKQAALAARAKRYGIAARDDASLTYPSGDPTTEALYGDPVNLAYPLGRAANEPDPARIRNALARFKGNADTYADERSRARVYERIVRAALAADITVSVDPEDAVDALLPADLQDALTVAAKAASPDPAPEPVAAPEPPAEPPAAPSDAAWLADAAARVDALDHRLALEERVRALDAACAEVPPTTEPTPDPVAEAVAKREADLAASRAREAALAEELRKAQTAAARLRQHVSGATARRPGAYPAPADTADDRVQWPSDLAREVTER